VEDRSNLALWLAALPLAAREKKEGSIRHGVIVNIPLPESEVTQVVQDVVQNESSGVAGSK
jgi:hypothetical protein